MAKVTTLHDIKARVTARWKHPRCKFQRGEFAEVDAQVLPRQYVRQDGKIAPGSSYVSKYKQRRAGQVGEVVAVSCLKDGRIRSNDWGRYGQPTRMFTRYYIQFSDGEILGYESHHLKKAFDLRDPK